MKIRPLLILIACLSCLPSAFATAFSNPTNGIYLAITENVSGLGIPSTNEPFHFNDNLNWATYCNTGKISIWYPVDHAYGVKIKMFAPDGKEVPKTALGDSFGSKWDRLHDYKSTRLQPIYAWGSFKENQGESSGGILPAPKELFEMKDPAFIRWRLKCRCFVMLPLETLMYGFETCFAFLQLESKWKIRRKQKQN